MIICRKINFSRNQLLSNSFAYFCINLKGVVMKKIFVSIFIILFYGVLPLSADPVIEIADKEFDFGELLPGQVVHHTYIVKNTGTKDLIIKEVNPSCGCTTAILQEKIVGPGKSVKIEADLTAQMNEGAIRKNINVVSNDPKNPTTIIYMNAKVKLDFLIEPKSINIGDMFIGDKKEIKFNIKPVNKKPFDPFLIEYSKTTFVAVDYKAINPNDPLSEVEFTVQFFAAPILKPRKAYEKITIYPYKNNKTLNIFVPFEGKISGYIEQSASSIFRKVEKSKGFKEIVNFKHLKDKPYTIISASSNNENVTTKIVKISDSNYDLEIYLKEGSILNKKGLESKKEDVAITIKTDQEDSKEMYIYMTFLIN